MPRTRSPEREQAEKLYLDTGGKAKLVDIASQLNLPEGTIRGWKNKDGWDSKLNGTLQKNTERSKQKKKKGSKVKEPVNDIIIDNPELTERQRLFCLYYIKSFNATMAAIKAGYAPDSAFVEGSRQLRNVKVANEIKRLKGQMHQELFIDAMDILNKYVKIAFADMNDFVDFGTEELNEINQLTGQQLKDEKGKPLTYRRSYMEFKDSKMIDGSLICEIKTGKQGMSIKLEDRQKALDKLAQYFDLFPDKWKRKIEEQKLALELKKAGENEDPEPEDDGFLEALNAEAAEVWSDED